MKKITSILIFIFAGIILSAQSDTTKNVREDSTVFTFCNIMPTYGRKSDGFQKYIMKNVHYLQTAREAGKSGNAYVGFTVEKNGSVSNIHIEKSSGVPELDAEALRVISCMPHKWKPGMMNGKKVRVSVIQPIKFVLE